ncbi:ABC transporter ATP-binding protein [Cupriavidus plantarum]|uniref:ABC transporter ATP-binding protein n=1 Tax=Cupriavidus plantarum TaxID=942865 RepID=UPI001B00F633|nr:ABC transporter ATP-binding protein [Cupriavidus plantarum]CAG2137496.1 Glutathione import ATP-binding protein GsiA [Cupriavidus plantarum]SMR84925.1 peptide/nickel transport system ATP-binding protein [Cupriavidus plantarum]
MSRAIEQDSPPVLEVRHLTVRLPDGGDRRHAVQDVSLTVRPRETVCIVGESGSGKSVTSSAVMGLLPRDVLKVESGQILLAGQDITRASPAELQVLRGHRMAMIFQEPMTALNPLMRIGDQIAEVFTFHAKDMDTAARDRRVLALLADVHLPQPETIRHAYPHQLSGGQRQRVMIAMALAMEPGLIIADEPTTALDVTSQAQVLRLLKELSGHHDNGVLFITHDFDVVAEIADRVIVMQSGRIVEQGTADEVLNRPRHAYTQRLLDARPRGDFRAPPLPESAPTALAVRDLTMRFETRSMFRSRRRSVLALDAVSLSVRRGETLGIVGESGSGKSTLGRCIARFNTPTSGDIELDGQSLSSMDRHASRAWRKRVQMVFQDPFRSFNPRLTIGRTLAEGPMNFAKNVGASHADVEARMREMLQLVSMDVSALDRYPHEFSGGQRQRLSIARALMMDPEILIADEAVSALDVSVQAQILDLLESIRERLGVSIVFITHDLRVAARLCHRIVVMQRGQIVEAGSARDVFLRPQSAYTRDLVAAIPGQQGAEATGASAAALAGQQLPAGGSPAFMEARLA